jgi:hypothetical protein
MRRRRVLSLLPALALLASPLYAQAGGTFEFGLFARSHWFGESYILEHKSGPGVRLGYFFARGLQVEVDGSWIPTFVDSGVSEGAVNQVSGLVTGDKVRAWVFHGRLLYHLPIGDHSALMAGAGWGFNRYSDDLGSENGPGGLIGARLGLGGRVSIRVDGTLDYVSDPAEGLQRADKDWHYGLQAGLSWLFGPRAGESFRADADGDGVTDNLDQCPDTPANTRVNPSGCPPPNLAADSVPADTGAAAGLGAVPADTAAADTAMADTAAVGVPADTTVDLNAGVPADTAMQADTAAAQPDTAAALPAPAVAPIDTAAAQPDTMAADTAAVDTAAPAPADTAAAQPEVERTPMPVQKERQPEEQASVERSDMQVRKDDAATPTPAP